MYRILSIFLLLFTLVISPVYAIEGNTGTSNVKPDSTSEQNNETKNSEDEYEVIAYTEKEVETNFTSKAYQVDGSDKNNYLVEGGNENAINSLATKQNTAQGSVIESTDVQGYQYDLEILSEEEKANKNPIELRQFISFETKSGKVFHLIIDHSKPDNNVQMLTEVSEQDLLNLIEENAGVALILSEEVSENSSNSFKTQKETNITVGADDTDAAPIETNDNTSLIIIIAASVIAGIAGWYFKIHKPKQSMAYDEEVDETDYIDEEMCVEDEEIS
jgi:hypothetical protein